jgi:two-component system phosphate regulon sensor histidine kinase PhoR
MASMMKKSFVIVAVLIASGCFFGGILSFAALHHNHIVSKNLENMAAMFAPLVPPSAFLNGEAAADWARLARLGNSGDYRITLIDRNGKVVFDTHSDIAKMRNHLDRPEFQAAIQGGQGSDKRKSATLGRHYWYAAFGTKDASGTIAGVFRISCPATIFSADFFGTALPFLLGGFALILLAGIGLYRFACRLSASIEVRKNAELEEATSELRARTEESEAQGRLSDAVLNGIFEGLIALDSNLNITLINSRLRSLLGIDDGKDARGLSLLAFSRSPELDEAARQVLALGQLWN